MFITIPTIISTYRLIRVITNGKSYPHSPSHPPSIPWVATVSPNNKIRMQSQQFPQRRGQNYSLQADLLTGWKPKLKIIGPMPLNYDNPLVDKAVLSLLHQESAFYEVVFLGSRPLSTFRMHEQLAKDYKYKYAYLLHNDFPHLKPFFKKFYSLFEPQVKRPFHGMNPNIARHQLVFESLFQCGNLDCVVRLKSLQYDLILRVDSNTSGHVLWFYFKIHNPEKTSKKVRLNIVNLRRNRSAYERGMRPFVRREGGQWRQEGYDVEVTEEKLRYHKQNLAILIEENQNQLNLDYFRKVSFCLDLDANQRVELAYCIPYTYSQLLEDVRGFKKKAECLQGIKLDVDVTHESLSGLEIPILKIHQGQAGNGKYCAFVIGRQHPGESNSSHVLKGSLDRLLSGEEFSLKLLKHCDFVVIPMLNPDGVIAGNFRTSLFGKDLNRLFKAKDTTLLPQIEMARSVFGDYSQIYKRKLLLFLDYHGHSTRKNAFFLGPGIFDAQLLNDIRILPKIIAAQTEIFRYPSCSFRLEESKKTTARALFGKLAGLSYTIETSNWSYYSQKDGQDYDFTQGIWQQLGRDLMKGVQEFVLKKVEAKKKFETRKDEQVRKLKLLKSRQEVKMKPVTDRQKATVVPPVLKNNRSKELRSHTETKVADLDPEDHEQFIEEKQEKTPSEVKQANESDEMSENGMDSDGSAEDMQKSKFKRYIKAASQMLVQFEEMYYGESYKKAISKYRTNNHKSNKLLTKQKKKKMEAVQACLRPNESKKTDLPPKQQGTRQLKRKLYLQDQIVIRDSLSKAHSQAKELSVFRKRILFQPSRKVKVRIGGEAKQQPGFTEQLQRFQKIHLIQADKQSLGRRRNIPEATPKKTQASNPVLIINSKNVNLPFIKDFRGATEKGVGNTGNLAALKTQEKMAELISVQEKMNKSAVLNVLRLSRVELDSNHYF